MKKKFLIPFTFACAMLFACSSRLVVVPSNLDDLGVHEIVMNVNNLSLSVGESEGLFVSTDSDEVPVTWVNGDSNVLNVVNDGKNATVTALSVGYAYVTAISGTVTTSCKVVVGGAASEGAIVKSISLSETVKVMASGENFVLAATINPSSSSPNIAWATTDDSVVSVTRQTNNTALVTAKGEGKAAITAVALGKTATCVVSVQNIDPAALYIALDKSNTTVRKGDTVKLNATTRNSTGSVLWQSNDQGVATVDQTGLVTGVATGRATITATAYDAEGKEATASCVVNVAGSEGVKYDWSQPGHLYIHYLRENDDYDDWAVWIWQKLPDDLDGSLWGATKCPASITSMSQHWMTNAECGGSGDAPYSDNFGQVVDINLTAEHIIGGKTGVDSPIIGDWTNLAKARVGFLIVDQTKMGGGTHWTSDGSADTWIKNLDEKFPAGKDSYLHIFCIEGAVNQYTTGGGSSVKTNPTIKDTSGKYRSANDISNLKYDAFTTGVSTSETFLKNRPGTGYQIFVPSFADSDGDGIGDLRGIIDKLDYLENLGIDVLWLTPIQESDSYHGYDVTDYYKVDSKFGTIEDYQELIYEAHQRDMKVLMDMVINHTSKNNVLFQKSQRAETETINGKTINYRNMYLWKFEGDKVREWDGVVPDTEADPNAKANYVPVNVEDAEDWYRDGTSNYFYFGKFGSGMAELNYSCQDTRDYMTDMCKYWLSFGLDGFRLDAIKHIYLLSELDPATSTQYANDDIRYDVSYRSYYDSEMQEWVYDAKNDYSYDRDLNVLFWKQFSGVIKSAYPNCFLVGENFDGWNERIAPFYSAIDSQFDFSTYYHLNEISSPASIGSDIKQTLEINQAFRYDHINGAFTSNHDIARLLNHAGANGDTSHTSEITSANKDLANKRARYFAAVTIFTPGVSWIYYGDELGMSGNLNDPVDPVDDHGNNIDRWYRQPMRWGTTLGQDSVPKYTFSGLNVMWDAYNRELPIASTQMSDPNSMYSYFKAACNIKQDSDYPTYGYMNWTGSCGSFIECAAFQITDGSRTVNVFVNLGDSAATIEDHNRGITIGSSVGGPAKGTTASTVPAHGFVVVKA